MSKSVLVIDTPEDCYSCYLHMVSRDLHFLQSQIETNQGCMY